jgi:hypothetical protein
MPGWQSHTTVLSYFAFRHRGMCQAEGRARRERVWHEVVTYTKLGQQSQKTQKLSVFPPLPQFHQRSSTTSSCFFVTMAATFLGSVAGLTARVSSATSTKVLYLVSEYRSFVELLRDEILTHQLSCLPLP